MASALSVGLRERIVAAIGAHCPAEAALADNSSKEDYRRNTVRVAVILAVPVME